MNIAFTYLWHGVVDNGADPVPVPVPVLRWPVPKWPEIAAAAPPPSNATSSRCPYTITPLSNANRGFKSLPKVALPKPTHPFHLSPHKHSHYFLLLYCCFSYCRFIFRIYFVVSFCFHSWESLYFLIFLNISVNKIFYYFSI